MNRKLTESKTLLATDRRKKKKKKRKVDDGHPRQSHGGKKPKMSTLDPAGQNEFTVLEDVHQFRAEKVVRKLPEWLAHPTVINSDLKDDSFNFKSLEGSLDHKISKALEQNGIHYFFPVQREVIPWLLSQQRSSTFYRPPDLCVSAPTGSGKTLAYVLPILQALRGRTYPCIRCLVVLPTEMLASQVFSIFAKFCPTVDLRPFLLSSKVTLTSERKNLIDDDEGLVPFDIIVTTPGRLLDHLDHTQAFDISKLKFLIVDEADRTLDDQEGDWLERLEIKFWASQNTGVAQPWKSIPLTVKYLSIHQKAFQKLLFSATLSANPESVGKINLFQPKLFASSRSTPITSTKQVPLTTTNTTTTTTTGLPSSILIDENQVEDSCGGYVKPPDLQESFVLCENDTKPLVLTHLINKGGWTRVLCFANTTSSTHRLALLLKFLLPNLQVREISSKWNARTRELILKKFGRGKVQVLVTSDLVARGIDIPSIDHVISYDLPAFTNTYVHRIGRTARAGQPGHALSLLTKLQIGLFRKTIKNLGGDYEGVEKVIVKRSELKLLEGQFKEALSRLKTFVEDEEISKINKRGPKPKIKEEK